MSSIFMNKIPIFKIGKGLTKSLLSGFQNVFVQKIRMSTVGIFFNLSKFDHLQYSLTRIDFLLMVHRFFIIFFEPEILRQNSCGIWNF